MSDCEIGISLACLKAVEDLIYTINVYLTLCEFHTKQMFHKNILKKMKIYYDVNSIDKTQQDYFRYEMKILGKLLIQCPTVGLRKKIIC